MEILYSILKIIWIIVLGLALIYLFFSFCQVIQVLYKNRSKYSHGLRFRYVHKLYHLRKHKFNKIFDFVKWVAIDIKRGRVRNKLFGIWCFTGYFGQGKTFGAVTYAKKVQRDYAKMGKKVHIYTNFSMVNQDGKITKWDDLLDLPPNTIVIFDEIQSTFTSQRFKEFPIELLWKITQCRKQQLCIFASSPVFSRMSIQLRENCDYVITCHNILNLERWFSYKFYRAPEYERYQDSPLNLVRKRVRSHSFIASDYDYKSYDTTQIVDRLDIEQKPLKFAK